MQPQVLRGALFLLVVLWMAGPTLGGQKNSPKILFTYKDKQYAVGDLTGVSDKEVLTIIGEGGSKYDLKQCPRPEGSWVLPAVSPWEPIGEVTRRGFYEHQCQGLLERFIRYEVFNLYKQRHPVDIKRYYRAELVREAMRRQAELVDRRDGVILTALDEKASQEETIRRLKKVFPKSSLKDQDWTLSIKGFSLHRPYYALNYRCFPWTVEGKPVPWVEHTFYSSLIEFHIQAEIERDKAKYIRMLEDRFGRRNYFVIRKAQEADKKQLLKLIDQVTNRKGEVAKGGLDKINETLTGLNSPTRMELWFGDKQNIAALYKISEERIKPRQFLSLGKTADGMESYLYIFQEEPKPHFKKYPSAPGNFLYGTGKDALLRPLIEEVRASLKPAKGVTVPSTDQIISAMGDPIFLDKLFGIQLPKVLLK